MNVKELKKLLETFNDDAEVIIVDSEFGENPLTDVIKDDFGDILLS